MKKRIVIHGATNFSNFGDMLFAHLFYRECEKIPDCEPFFLQMRYAGIGNHLREELGYTKNLSFSEFLKADAMVLMSGGYLGDDAKTIKNNIKRYFRYIFPARLFQLRGKPVYVLGVGGGPVQSRLLRKVIVKLLNNAKVIYVRDEETKEYFAGYGVKKRMLTTSDTAQVITREMLPSLNGEKELRAFFQERKVVFVHLVNGRQADALLAARVIPALNAFLEKHANYGVIVGMDGICGEGVESLGAFKAIRCEKVYYSPYTNSWQLCALLNWVDFVITPKLHVGIVSATLGKPVVSFPIHREKTQRYYRQIGQAERSIHIGELTVEKALLQMETYHNTPIHISPEITEKAKENLRVLHAVPKA